MLLDALEREERRKEKTGFDGLPGPSKTRRNGWAWQGVGRGLEEERREWAQTTPVSLVL